MSAGNDLKLALRKLDFPYCAREALSRIGTSRLPFGDDSSSFAARVSEYSSGGRRVFNRSCRFSVISEVLCCRPGKQVDLQMDVISEFVFGELDRRKKRNVPMAMQELQLIEVMSDFFQSPGATPAVRNALFLSLFPADSSRYNTLGKLVSLAIATQNKAILNAAGIWMQQLGSTSQQSVRLAWHLLYDYFALTPKAVDKLKQLPVLAPHFTANLLTAIGEVYENKDPPTKLLALVGEWIEENPSLLSTPLTDNPALPSGGIPMTPITPIAGLFRYNEPYNFLYEATQVKKNCAIYG